MCAVPHLQREIWNGPSERLFGRIPPDEAEGDHTLSAVCEVWSHEFGWELRLMIDGHGLQMSSVARSANEMTDTADKWLAALAERGGCSRHSTYRRSG